MPLLKTLNGLLHPEKEQDPLVTGPKSQCKVDPASSWLALTQCSPLILGTPQPQGRCSHSSAKTFLSSKLGGLLPIFICASI